MVSYISLLFYLISFYEKQSIFHKDDAFAILISLWALLLTQMVKNLLAEQGTQVRSLGQEDPLKREMAIQSSTLSWRIPWAEEPGVLPFMGSQQLDTIALLIHTHIFFGEVSVWIFSLFLIIIILRKWFFLFFEPIISFAFLLLIINFISVMVRFGF